MISVIIPLYNKERSIQATIQSVLEQTYTDFELIIVDDGSTDNSVSVVQSFNDKRIMLYNKENGGVSSARNYGVEKSKRKWVVFLDADDLLLPNALKILCNEKLKYNVNIVAASYYYNKRIEDGKLTIQRNCNRIINNNLQAYYWGLYTLRIGAFLVDRICLIEHPFRTDLSRFEDLCTCLDLMKYYKIAAISFPVMIYTNEFRELSYYNKNNLSKDFVFNLDFRNKFFIEKLIYGQLLCFVPNNSFNNNILRSKYKRYYGYKYIAKVGLKVKTILRKINQLFYLGYEDIR